MIGQSTLQQRLNGLIMANKFPRFSILVGPRGSGKKTLAHKLAGDLQALTYDCDYKVDAVREMISNCYKIREVTCYIIANADDMSIAAKNALLKVTEESPNNAYFIMTLQDEANTIETIRSRGTIFHMDRYTPSEIYQYAKENTNYTLHDDEWDIIKDICDTPGEVDMLGGYPKEFYDYVQLVVDNIAEVSLANAFKISTKIALKSDSKGYDLKLFWKAFLKVIIERRIEIGSRAVNMMRITSKYLQRERIKGVNKQMLFDNWILEIRSLWI